MRKYVVALSLIVLSACGGGGGSNAANPVGYTPQLDSGSVLQGPMSSLSLPRRFTLVDLGTFIPRRINKYGVIVGDIPSGISTLPAVWKNGVVHKLPQYSYPNSSVTADINDSGTVIGTALNTDPNAANYNVAVTWDSSGKETSYGDDGTWGVAINNSGRLIGTWGNSVLDLRTNSPIAAGTADAENDLGTVLFDNGVTVCEITLSNVQTCFPKAPGAVKAVQGMDINNHNDAIANDPVLCSSTYNPCIYRGIYYHAGIETVIYAPRGSNDVQVSGLNNAGWVVGTYGLNVPNAAFVFFNGTMTNLNSYFSSSSGIYLNSASDVNDSGEIVGTFKGATHGYLLRPVY